MLKDRLRAGLLACLVLLGTGTSVLVAAAPGQDGRSTAAAPPLNLNSATAADLEKLPGVGTAMATRILDYRQKSGGFKKIEDILEISGSGAYLLGQLLV